jgi:TonB-like protein
MIMLGTKLGRAAFAGVMALTLGSSPLSAVASEPTLDLSTIPDATFLHPSETHGSSEFGPVGPYYPEVASRAGVSGVAVIECTVSAKGELDRCATIAEFPGGCFFGAAARRLAEVRRIGTSPRVVDGQPVGGDVVRLKVQFHVPRPSRRQVC